MHHAPTFTLTISKVNELVYQNVTSSATFPGTEGEFTVLAHHEPLITLLREGLITVRDEQGVHTFPITKGVFEASHGQVTVLL